VGNGALDRLLALAFIAIACVGLTGCAPQSTSGFQAVADPSQSAAAVRRQPPQAASTATKGDPHTASVLPAPVDAAGTIALPLIGAVPVAGKTVREIESEISQRLKAKYLQNPQVLVSVKDAVGLRVAVQGAVKSPGVIPLHGDTTLTNVIAQSGGFTEISDQSQVVILRNTDQGRVASKVDAGAILSGSAPDPQVYGGDTVVVGESFIRNVEKDALTLTGGVSSVGWLLLR
jgi:polysaccharide biosynthesis/export protein